MRRAACALLLLTAAAALADPPKVPDPLKLPVGEDATVTVKVPAGQKGAFRAAFDPADCTFFRGWSDAAEEMVFLVRPKRPGKFRVVFWTVGEAASSELVVDAGDPPPPPTPGPAPPGPAPPAPDALAAAVRAAYDADPSPTKAADAASLAAVFRALAAPGSGVNDPAVKTAGQMADVVQKARAALVGDRLAAVRNLFGVAFNAGGVPRDPAAALSDADRKTASDLLTRFATTLDTLR